MNVEELAALAHARHELRTPLGHIIGYAEMLLEELEGAGPGPLEAPLQALHADARQLLSRLNALLAPPADGGPAADLGALFQQLVGPAQATVTAADELKQAARAVVSDDLHADVEKIAVAAARFRDLLRDGSLGAPSAPARVHAATTAGRHTESRVEAGAILVIDDNASNRDLITRRLTREGHQVQSAADGREGLEKLRARPFDVILLDVLMPDKSGAEVLQELKGDPELRHIPVLMISALDEMDTVIRCIELGAEDYLAKPFDTVLLRARVGACLEKKRLRDEQAQHARELGEWNLRLEQRVQEQVAQMERLSRLKRFFVAQVADLIVTGEAEDPLKTHRREIVVVFLDLRGFTAFAEVSEPEEVMTVLREYHAAVGRIIMDHEGTVERFAGDGIMIFFNDPVVVDNPAERAARMALAIRDSINELSRVWRRRGHQLGVGIGIAQGYATIGAIGFEGRWDYGAIGTVTNLAARLCGEAKAGQILASTRVADAVEDVIESAEVEPVTLKGFHRPMPAVDVLKLKTAS
ncbi:MAG TPA: response regulator [Candidatus Methylomirabilis sp.]|nr:response regulator [Candidatus Methylomirabilis sp.]